MEVLDEEIGSLSLSGPEDDAKAVAAKVRDLKIRRNACTPLCSLPSDVLLRILQALIWDDYFVFCDDLPCYKQMFPHWAFTKPKQWLAVTGVCTNLRDVVCGYPLFWTNFDFRTAPEWRNLCLERSASLPLSVCSSDAFHVVEEITPALMHRVQNLICDRYKQLNAINQLLEHESTSLQSLSYLTSWPNHYNLSSTLLGGRATSLKEFLAFRIYVAANPPQLSSLTRLHLDWILTDDDPVRLHALLASAPDLESLALHRVMCQSLNYALSPLHLPRLRSLHIGGSLQFMVSFLPILPVPAGDSSFTIELSAPRPKIPDTDPRAVALRIDAFKHFQRFCGPSTEDERLPILVVHFYSKPWNFTKKTYYRFTMEHRDSSGRKVTYEDKSKAISGFGTAWTGVKLLHVHGGAIADLFEFINAEQGKSGDALVDVEHLVIRHPEGDLSSLEKWLAIRAEHRPLRVLELTGLKYVEDLHSVLLFGQRVSEIVGEASVELGLVTMDPDVIQDLDTDCDLDDEGSYAEAESDIE
jgi:hypothetical protein